MRADGALDLYHGGLRARDAEGKTIFDHVDYDRYWEQISEDVKAWSYMKFPFLKALGPEEGWYRVGPLTRVTRCDFIPTPLADRERREFLAFDDGRAAASTLGFHWARMIEMLHAAEAIKDLLHDDDLLGTDLMAGGKRQARGVGVIEAPRGTLIHHYRVDENDQVVRANLIVSTTHNNQAMNLAIREVARKYLDGRQLTEGLLNHIEVAVRAFDPCLSCATHAMGKMPLSVQLLDAAGDRSISWCADDRHGPVAGAGRRQPEPRRRRARTGTGRSPGGRGLARRRGTDRLPAADRARPRPGRAGTGHLRRCGNRDAGAVRVAPVATRRRVPAHLARPFPGGGPGDLRTVQGGPPPESWALCVRGEAFELGDGLSAAAAEHLEQAWLALRIELARARPH